MSIQTAGSRSRVIDITFDDTFWAPRIEINRQRTIPGIYELCKVTGRIDALKLDWEPGKEPKPHVFWDSDVAKWIEAASYSIAAHPDEDLKARVNELVQLVISVQQPDGYLNSYFTSVDLAGRWTDLRDSHELYCAGHMMEAAVAHYEATGEASLLDAMCRYADYIYDTFGTAPGKKRGYPGHEEIELALVKLYRATGNSKYLELSKYFVDERGNQPHYFDHERENRGGTPSYFEWYYNEPGRTYSHEYNQSHKPVREQDQVVGHAVRAMYLYSAMADLAQEYQDEGLAAACKRLWNHLTEGLLYITGGIGSTDRNEGFTQEYDLPNEHAYCETCASIGLFFWGHRMLKVDFDGRYADTMEQVLYNLIASGVGLDGTKFFYDNPLQSQGMHHRQTWFDVSCCPPNASRLLASLGKYVYSEQDNGIDVHLYIQNTARLQIGGQIVKLRQKTDYPYDGNVMIEIDPTQPATFAIRLRIPGWCRNAHLVINGEEQSVEAVHGYVTATREWRGGDVIVLSLDMPVERVHAHPNVRMDRGRIAIQRGPVVYCVEEIDNGSDLDAIVIPDDAVLSPVSDSQTIHSDVTVIEGTVARLDPNLGSQLYRFSTAPYVPFILRAIPYFLWDNREGAGEMMVWLRRI